MKISNKFLELTSDWLYQSYWNINSYKVLGRGWKMCTADEDVFWRMIGVL